MELGLALGPRLESVLVQQLGLESWGYGWNRCWYNSWFWSWSLWVVVSGQLLGLELGQL